MEIIHEGLFFFDEWRHLILPRVLPSELLLGLDLPQDGFLLPQTLLQVLLELRHLRGHQRDSDPQDALEGQGLSPLFLSRGRILGLLTSSRPYPNRGFFSF